MATHRTVEQRLAEATQRKERAAAQVKALEVEQRKQLARAKARGEKVALDLMLGGIAADASLADALWALADKAGLPADKRAALALVLGTEPERPSKSKAA